MLQEKGPLPGPETGLLSNIRKWIVRGDTRADKARDFIAKGHRAESSRVREPRRTGLSHGLQASFRVVFSQSFWLRALPGGAGPVQPRWMPERRILGGGQTCGVSFWPFPNSSGWWRLISSLFLTRPSCPKTTRANGYYGAWPGWAVSISVLPLTVVRMDTIISWEKYKQETIWHECRRFFVDLPLRKMKNKPQIRK